MEIGKSLAHIDWDKKMKNMTATECWDMLRGELDRAIDSYVPMKKQGKRSKKIHLSKEAFIKMRYKQNMWRVYKHTGKDKDYEAYKEALNAATNEVRKANRNCEHKLAQNIKSDSKSFYAYVRSKQNIRNKVGPLEEKAFDTVGHCILINKLQALGFDTCSREWFRSYLTNRKQLVDIGGTLSPFRHVTCGVPQGSILGPLLFLVYVNDMCSAVNCKLLLYADDSALIVPGKYVKEIELK